MSCLHQIEPQGEVNFLTGIKIAQLALKHRYFLHTTQFLANLVLLI